jgi:hypothetical protein
MWFGWNGVSRMTLDIIRKKDFVGVAKQVKIDKKRRIVLPEESLISNDVTFHVYANSAGQIILDPQISIPASEAWLYTNPEILKAAKRGLQDIAEGRVSKVKLDTL